MSVAPICTRHVTVAVAEAASPYIPAAVTASRTSTEKRAVIRSVTVPDCEVRTPLPAGWYAAPLPCARYWSTTTSPATGVFVPALVTVPVTVIADP